MGSDCRSVYTGHPAYHFNPRPPHGERRRTISYTSNIRLFQSTLPAWGATFVSLRAVNMVTISSHAPRMGSDNYFVSTAALIPYFNPRSPHGERPHFSHNPHRLIEFQSTLPAWGATISTSLMNMTMQFQSTLPAWGATVSLRTNPSPRFNFNPRSPHGERPVTLFLPSQSIIFQSTLPAWGATAKT